MDMRHRGGRRESGQAEDWCIPATCSSPGSARILSSSFRIRNRSKHQMCIWVPCAAGTDMALDGLTYLWPPHVTQALKV